MSASIAARRLVALANQIPTGHWASYGDLADAYVNAHAANMVARGVASALSLLPVLDASERAAIDPQARVDEWPVPWHRIRNADGHAVTRLYGALSTDDFTNRMFVAEGGMIRQGAATAGCRANLLAALRSSNTPRASWPELTDEQRARLSARARARQERLDRQ